MATTFSVDLAFKTAGMGGLKAAQQELAKMSGSAGKAKNGIVGFERGLGGASGAAKGFGKAIAGALGPLIGITSAIGAVSKALQVMGDRQADTEALRNGLEKLGAVEGTLDALAKKADEFGKKTLFSQEDYTKAAGILTSFTNVAIADYDRLIKVSGDVAQVMGTDVKSATTQLAKALNDPTQGLTALTRSGITFSEAQKEMINGMVKAGDLAGAQKMIFEELEKQYKGAAEAAGGGLAGAFDNLSEVANDAFEALGKMLEPIAGPVLGVITAAVQEMADWWNYLSSEVFPAVYGAVQPALRAMDELIKELDLGWIADVWNNFLSGAFSFFLEGLKQSVNIAVMVIKKLTEIAQHPAMQALGGAIKGLFEWMGLANGEFTKFKQQANESADATKKLEENIRPVPEKIQSAEEAAKALKKAQAEVTKEIQAQSKAIDDQLKNSEALAASRMSLMEAEMQTALTLNQIALDQANNALQQAKTAEQREAAAKRVYDLTVQQADIERQMSLAAIAESVRKARAAMEALQLKMREVQATIALAEANKTVTREHYEALGHISNALELSEQQYGVQQQIAAAQMQQVNALYKAKVEAAGAAQEANRAHSATSKAASSAGAYAANMQKAAGAAASAAQSAQLIQNAGGIGLDQRFGAAGKNAQFAQAFYEEQKKLNEKIFNLPYRIGERMIEEFNKKVSETGSVLRITPLD